MVHYEAVVITIDAPGLADAILDILVRHHGLSDSIVSDRGSVFISKFWPSLCYFLGIKRRLSWPSISEPLRISSRTMELASTTSSTELAS